ncbi:hypothetical protein TSAR_013673 [Trichomalopsis sarcophagae]|uniref:Uncharacterized protein n=1 Tax=Trichomalopsis sarcophagae TaxID=543379 RepID=A0A232EN40_9HYME|nr:hypothetical protein TSAR_013673 [Trichomalopsis sarcophagae]
MALENYEKDPPNLTHLKIKSDPNLTVLGNSVNKICETVSGDLLLKQRRTNEVTKRELHKSLKAVLVDEATIKKLQHKVVLRIKNLVMLTSKQDILEALSREFSKEKEVVEKTSVKTLRKMEILSLPTYSCLPRLPKRR